MQITCRECLESASALCFTRLEAPQGDKIRLQEVSGIFIWILFYMISSGSTGDANHLLGVSRVNVRIVLYMV